ncbi:MULTISPECIES: hypothetical protein [Buttiauxella]|uniref:hypothetical protein n=1 Tax=Buttiauxella TaxID=82976 RepID=UPI001E61BE2F|nr:MULTISPECIES: hypothetical protein [Buttiauxella]MCS3602422.1 hypothetical protein [Buttiauxella sp. BIGb0471]
MGEKGLSEIGGYFGTAAPGMNPSGVRSPSFTCCMAKKGPIIHAFYPEKIYRGTASALTFFIIDDGRGTLLVVVHPLAKKRKGAVKRELVSFAAD